MINKFSLRDLDERYNHILPQLQTILKAVLFKDDDSDGEEGALQRHRDEVH